MSVWLALAAPLPAQRELAGTAEIKQALDRLPVVGSAMMIAAHPDDENTALLAYFARGRKVRTAYLSLNRGEGGQNLIGPEQGALLGLIRTQELLAARRIDGARQFFTRSIDFGFSKTAGETLAKWGRQEVLADIVFQIRRFQPDILILRFSGTERDGHGHHQASALLGLEGFSAAADATRFPEQLARVQPWKARRILHNLPSFTRDMEREAERAAGALVVDTGMYDPVLGYSYAEIAGMSRSQHRSQAMGSAERKGTAKQYLIVKAGEAATKDPFDGIDMTWARLGAADVGTLLSRAARDFVPEQPERSVPLLLQARARIAALRSPEATRKLAEVEQAILLCAGLWLDASADRHHFTPGSPVRVTLTALNRSDLPVRLESVALEGMAGAPSTRPAAELANNIPRNFTLEFTVPADEPYSQPYWLRQPDNGALYRVEDLDLLGLPEGPPVLRARFQLRVMGEPFAIVRPVSHRYVDRVRGELTRPLAVVPPVALRLSQDSLLFPGEQTRPVTVEVRSNRPGVEGELGLEAPAGWRVAPPSQNFRIALSGELLTLRFDVTPPAAESRGDLQAIARVQGAPIRAGMTIIDYPHIPPQTVFPPASARLVRTAISVLSRRVGYVMGAGDDVPGAMRELGCDVTLLGANDLAQGDLDRFDAIVTGVRAYNTRPDLRASQQRLLDYVRDGGTMVVQYNVQEGGFFGGDTKLLERIGPYPITIGRGRVSVEDAPVEFLNADHPLLQRPNRITARDFEGWVQERGLYFASQWDPRYEAVIASHDPAERPLAGGLLYARVGKGVYVFTSYSWFRQLPAGVPGAFRIFANLLSAGKVAP